MIDIKTLPYRIQLKRDKGWRMLENAVICDRRSVWGNPYKIVKKARIHHKGLVYHVTREKTTLSLYYYDENKAVRQSLRLFDYDIEEMAQDERREWLKPLLGENLACWCSKESRCHCDILFKWLMIEFEQEYLQNCVE